MHRANYKAKLECICGDTEIHRFSINSEDATSFVHLENKVKMAFQQLNGNQFNILWMDEENEEVTIGNDEELAIALVSLPVELKKILIHPKQCSKVSNMTQEEYKSAEKRLDEFHNGISCDACGSSVSRFRYKCFQCIDYDLCEKCEAKHLHPEHVMVRFPGGLSRIMYNQFWKQIFLLGHCYNNMMEPSSQNSCHTAMNHSDSRKMKSKKCKSDRRRPCCSMENDSDIGDWMKKSECRRLLISKVSKSFSDFLNNCDAFVNPLVNRTDKESAASGEQLKKTASGCDRNAAPTCESHPSVHESNAQPAENSAQAVIHPEPTERNENIPTSSDSEVDRALKTMLEMGFTNEGDGLRTMLEKMDGDIAQVLELIERVLK